MTETLTEAVMKELNLTRETIRIAQKTVRDERKQVWCLVCTEERAALIAKTHSIPVVTTGYLNDLGKLTVQTKNPGTYR